VNFSEPVLPLCSVGIRNEFVWVFYIFFAGILIIRLLRTSSECHDFDLDYNILHLMLAEF
jgi:hypothetical protein